MSLTVATIITNFNTYVGDASTDRITAAERLQYVNEAVIWLMEELKNDHQVKTYDLTFIDTVNYYRVTTPLADLLEGSDLRRKVGENINSMTHKSSRELAEDIAQGQAGDDAWAIERRDGATFLVINAAAKFQAMMLEDFENSDHVDYWVADTTTSDALNVVQELNRFNQGSASLSFDINDTQSGNNKAVLTNNGNLSFDLSTFEGIGVFLMDVYLPTVDTIASFNLRWGQDSSNYWSATVTTDLDGSAFVVGWNTIAFDWSVASTTGSPDADTDVDYFLFTMNYGAGQVDETNYLLDNFRVANTEELKFYYVSFDVGTSSGGTPLITYTATTDIPFFSGQYDQYKYAVAHMAASLAFDNLRLKDDAMKEEIRANKALSRARKTFPSSATPEIKSFKVHGNNLTLGRRRA